MEIRKQIASLLEVQEAEIKSLKAALQMQKTKAAYQSEVSQLPELPFEKRIRELCQLPSGWYDGSQGEKVSLMSINNARILLEKLYKDKPTLVPAISPSVEGDVSLTFNGIGVRIEAGGTVVLLHQGQADELDFNTNFENIAAIILREAQNK